MGCESKKSQSERDIFYETVSGWDIIHIPIVPPFRATSTYPNVWLITGSKTRIKLDENRHGDIPVLAFGVVQEYICGSTPIGYSNKADKWFLFNTTTYEYDEYESEQGLLIKLESLKLEKPKIEFCDVYFDKLINGETCYWFPKIRNEEKQTEKGLTL